TIHYHTDCHTLQTGGWEMEIRSTIYKNKTGRHQGKWTLEIRFRADAEDPWRRVARQFRTQLEAKRERAKLEVSLTKTDGNVTKGSRMTFSDVCRVAEEDFLAPAVIR